MMEAVLPRSWKEEFALAAAVKREDILQREKMARFDARQRQVTEEQRVTAQKREAQAWAAIEFALAPPARVIEFRVELDRYDTKTVEALIENQEALDAVRHRIDDMLDRATVLPDGRRVFKTADGQSVYDETGQKLSHDFIDPSSIDDKKPKWEAFKGVNDERARLTEERQSLNAYQTKLDGARERLDKGDITDKDLTDMKADLTAAMPDSVREKLGIEKPKADVGTKFDVSVPVMPDGMDNLMRQTGFAPAMQSGPR